MILKNWGVITTKHNPFLEYTHYYLQGNVYGHPRFEDGTNVTTSRIVEVHDKGDYKEVITRSGSVYELHKENISAEYEYNYPNAYERLQLV